MSLFKDAAGNELFPYLPKFFLTLCSLPHSSAGAERQFSILSVIKTKNRNKLNISTVSALMKTKQLVLRSSSGVHDRVIPSDLTRATKKWKQVDPLSQNSTLVDALNSDEDEDE